MNKIYKDCEIDILSSFKKLSSNLLIIPGGNTIIKFSSKKEDIIRNKFDNFFFNKAITKKIPIIGICHGAQFIAERYKGSLIKDQNHGKLRNHYVDLIDKKNSYLVNSFHNISLKKLPKNFFIYGRSKNHNIELFKHKKKNVLGIMWHPERNTKIKKLDKEIFKNFKS